MSKPTEKVEPAEQAAPSNSVPSDSKPSNSRGRGGGRGARDRRNQNRRGNSNSFDQGRIESFERKAITAPNQIKWKPSFGLYAGSVGIGGKGYVWYLKAMTTRLKSVAQRPLAILMTDQNVMVYHKVAIYLLHVRLCCAQDDAQTAVPGLTLRGELTEADKRAAVGMSRSIPRSLAYALNTFGYFKVDTQLIVPTLPARAQRLAALQAVDFSFLVYYVNAHLVNPVPPNAQAIVAQLQQLLPMFEVAPNHMFTPATAAFWVDISPEDWEVFREINAATKAQGLNIEDFDLSAATGQPAQIVRYEQVADPMTMAKFYSIRPIDETELVRSLALRPGDDTAAPAAVIDRFRLSFDIATLRGFDLPASAIEATLQSLVVRESPI